MRFLKGLFAALALALSSIAPASAQLLATQTINVADLTALKGVHHNNLRTGATALVSDASKGGKFKWTTGDQSSSVTADTTGALWAAPTSASTGASGAWQRIVEGAFYRASWFGVTCDYNSGTLAGTNNTAAMRAIDPVIEAAGAATLAFDRGTTGNCLVYEAGDSDAALLDLSSAVKQFRIITNGVIFHTEKDWTSTQAAALILRSIGDFSVDGKLEVYNGEVPASEPDYQFGLRFLNFYGYVGRASAQVKCTGGVQCLRVTRLADGSEPLSTHRATNLDFDVETDRTFYPLSLENNGFGVNARVKSNRAGRSLTGYNGEDWDLYVNSTNPQYVTDVLLLCASDSNDHPGLNNVRLNYSGQPKPSENAEGGAVGFGVQGTVPCASTGLDVNILQAEDATNKIPVIFALFKQSSNGVVDNTAGRGHTWQFNNLTINGTAVGAYEVISLGGGSGYANGNFTGEDIRVDNFVVNLTGSSSSSIRVLDPVTHIGGGSIITPGTLTGFENLKSGSALSRVSASARSEGNVLWSNSGGNPTRLRSSDDAQYPVLSLEGSVVGSNVSGAILFQNDGDVAGNIYGVGDSEVWFGDGNGGDVIAKFQNDIVTFPIDIAIGDDLAVSDDVTITGDLTVSGTCTGCGSGSASDFGTVAVSGQSNVVSDSQGDTLTLAAGSNITLTTNAGTDTVTIAGTSFVAFKAYLSANQTSVADAAFTKVAFDTEVYDNGGYFNTTTNRWTPPAGPVAIHARTYATGTITAGSLVMCRLYKNGAAFANCLPQYAPVANLGESSGFVTDSANGSDYYEVFEYIDTSSGTGTIDSGAGSPIGTYFEGYVIH